MPGQTFCDSVTVPALRAKLDRVVLTGTGSDGLDGIGTTVDGAIVRWQGGVRGEAMNIRNVENLPRVERPPAPRLPILALSATRCVQTDPETSGAWVALIPPQGSVLPAALSRIDLQCSRDVLAAAIAPTGRFVVGGTRAGRVRVWSTRDGRLLHEFEERAAGDMVTCVAVQIAPPKLRAAGVGFIAATGAFDGSTRVWHIPCGGAPTGAAEGGDLSRFTAGVELYFRQGDGFTRGDPGSGYEWDQQDIREAELAAHEDGTPLRFPVTQVALNCDGSLVAAGYSLERSPRWRQAVRVWSTVDGSTAQPPTLFGYGSKQSDVRCLTFHPTRRTVLAVDEEGIGRAVDVAKSEEWAKRFYGGVVSAMCWSADGRDLMTATWSSPGPVQLEVQRLADPDGTCHDSAKVGGSAW